MIVSLIESILLVKKFRKSSVLNEELLAGSFCVSLAIVLNMFINVDQMRDICCPGI